VSKILIPASIEFELVGVPDSYSNSGIWSKKAAIAQSLKMKLWTQNVIAWGQTKRINAGWEIAKIGHQPRIITIHQRRHGELDEDNLYSSVKPLIDGCKTYIRRNKKHVYGAGLIWNDNPKHCHPVVTQERIALVLPTSTIIRVERFDL
jgi:hypothetical protein